MSDVTHQDIEDGINELKRYEKYGADDAHDAFLKCMRIAYVFLTAYVQTLREPRASAPDPEIEQIRRLWAPAPEHVAVKKLLAAYDREAQDNARWRNAHATWQAETMRLRRAISPVDSKRTDAGRLDWLEAMANQPGGLLLHDGHESGRCGLGLRPGQLSRKLREAIDQAMDALCPKCKGSSEIAQGAGYTREWLPCDACAATKLSER